MRRQDKWIELADRLGENRAVTVAVCTFLNMGRPVDWIIRILDLEETFVQRIEVEARYLLRRKDWAE